MIHDYCLEWKSTVFGLKYPSDRSHAMTYSADHFTKAGRNLKGASN